MRQEIVKDSPPLNRFLQTIDGFRAEFGVWPTEIVIGKEPYKQLTEEALTPTAFKMVEEKLHLLICEGPLYIALDDEGRASIYNWEPLYRDAWNLVT